MKHLPTEKQNEQFICPQEDREAEIISQEREESSP